MVDPASMSSRKHPPFYASVSGYDNIISYKASPSATTSYTYHPLIGISGHNFSQ